MPRGMNKDGQAVQRKTRNIGHHPHHEDNLKMREDSFSAIREGRMQRIIQKTRELFKRREHQSDLDGEEPLDMLKDYDTVILVDDSVSMTKHWSEVHDAVTALAEIAQRYDQNGIDIHFLHNKDKNVAKARDLAQIEQSFNDISAPTGSTSLLARELDLLLRDYQSKINEARGQLEDIIPINYIVFTDGHLTDNIEQVIVNAAERLESSNVPLSQVGIQFVQMGNDTVAAKNLRRLDDRLERAYHIRDIVDTTQCSNQIGEIDFAKILLGAINRNVDGNVRGRYE